MACFSNLEFEVNSFCDMKSNTDHPCTDLAYFNSNCFYLLKVDNINFRWKFI